MGKKADQSAPSRRRYQSAANPQHASVTRHERTQSRAMRTCGPSRRWHVTGAGAAFAPHNLPILILEVAMCSNVL